MPTIFNEVDAFWTLAALVPLAIAVAAWALQMSCGFCSVDPPEFWHAVTTVVIVAVANVILRFVLQVNGATHDMTTQYFMPAITTATVLAIALPTAPFTATTITVVQVVLCALIYYALCWLATLVTMPFSM
jgi:hypothetical protein